MVLSLLSLLYWVYCRRLYAWQADVLDGRDDGGPSRTEASGLPTAEVHLRAWRLPTVSWRDGGRGQRRGPNEAGDGLAVLRIGWIRRIRRPRPERRKAFFSVGLRSRAPECREGLDQFWPADRSYRPGRDRNVGNGRSQLRFDHRVQRQRVFTFLLRAT